MYIDIVWRSSLGLLIGKFLLAELSARHMSTFLFPDDYLGKDQWSFTKLGVGIAIVEI